MIQNLRSQIVTLSSRRWFLAFPDKLKGGRIERWKNYWLGVGRDYRDATTELISDSKASPVKTSIILTTTGFLGYCVKTNPSLEDYKERFIENSLDILQVSETIRNSGSTNLQDYISRAINANLVRRNNYGIFSVVWVDDFSEDLGVYSAQCEYLRPGLRDLRSRLIDVGFLGRWWISSRKMSEYDVNAEEWDEKGSPLQPSGQLKQMW